MAALEAAQQQLETAVARLEAAAARLLDRQQERTAAGEAAGRDHAALHEECQRLRGELAAAQAVSQRLAAAVDEAERRLAEAVARLDAVSSGG